jgi:large subunit ribosomal protein L17
MRHLIDGRKLGRTAAHRRATLRNLVIALIAHERIETTIPKAKEARRLAERCITFAKRGDLAARRHVAHLLHDKEAVQRLFAELGPRYKARPGGYTRVLRLGRYRKGDATELALLELVRDGDRAAGGAAASAAAGEAAPKGARKGAGKPGKPSKPGAKPAQGAGRAATAKAAEKKKGAAKAEKATKAGKAEKDDHGAKPAKADKKAKDARTEARPRKGATSKAGTRPGEGKGDLKGKGRGGKRGG